VRSVVPFFDFPTVIKSRIHGVLAFRTRQGPVALWAGPSRDGGVCFIIKRLRPKTLLDQIWTGVSTCVPKGVPGGRPLVAQVKSIEPTSNGGPAKDPTYAYGIVGKNIVRVEVRLSDGSVHRANVHEHFFGVGVPPKYPCTTRSCAYDAARVLAVGFDASGRKVGTYRQGAPPKPVPPPPPPARTGPFRTVFNAEKAGHRVVFGVAPAAGGGLCTQQSWSGQRGFRSPCRSRSHKTVELLGAGGGGPPDWGFLIGRAQNGVASVDLRFEDGTSTALQLTPGRFFLVFLGGRRTVPGHRALAFVARDRAGRVVARERLGHPLGG
jgi:hypothetical protein